MDPFIGEIRIFAGDFAPAGWMTCDGQLLPIQQNSALFSAIGTTYGGDGVKTFALPKLGGSVPMGQGNGPGLTPRPIGKSGGEASVMLEQTQIPSHTHAPACSSVPNQATPANNVWASGGGRVPPKLYASSVDTLMSPLAAAPTGNGQPHNNAQPYLPMTFIIALEGVFPIRP